MADMASCLRVCQPGAAGRAPDGGRSRASLKFILRRRLIVRVWRSRSQAFLGKITPPAAGAAGKVATQPFGAAVMAPIPQLPIAGTTDRAVGVLVAVDDPGDADHSAGRQVAAADRAGDQRGVQGCSVGALARVQQYPARLPRAGPVLNGFGAGQDAGRPGLTDRDAADPVAFDERARCHAARPRTAVPGRRPDGR